MEKQKRGRKAKPAHLKVQMVAAYLTNEQKALIIKEFGSVTNAIKTEILAKFMHNGYSNSTGNRI